MDVILVIGAPTLLKRLGDRGTISSDSISKGWLPGPWEGQSWILKTGKRLREDLQLKGQRRNVQLWVFYSKCSMKGRWGAHNQKDTCLKVSRSEREMWSPSGSMETGIKSVNNYICSHEVPSSSLDLLPPLISTSEMCYFSLYFY